MTLGKLLKRIHMLFETTYPDALLSDWVAEMDGRILKEDYLQQGYEIEYDPTNDENTVLLLREPWTNLYEMWLLQKVHFMRGEYDDAANFAEQWGTLHHDWLRNLLSTTHTDAFGRPWLANLAYVRRGSDGVVHMSMLFKLEDIEDLTVYLVQKGEVKITIEDSSKQLLVADNWLSVMLTGVDTAALNVGSASLIVEVLTVAGERYESDAAQIRVLESGLKGVTA